VRRKYLLRSGNKTLELGESTRVMGILNVTPDSFYDGGKYLDPREAVYQAEAIVDQGAELLDIGGQSTRPGASPAGTEEELRRVLPVLRAARKRSDTWISIDTYRSDVARACLEEGADMINDVSSFRMDPEMPPLIARARVPVVCMHFLKSIHPMPSDPHYEELFSEILDFFMETFRISDAAGIDRQQVIVDPGIGFGKRLEDNLKCLSGLGFLDNLDRPVLVGPSRKSFIRKIIGLEPEDRLEGTAAAAAVCILNGAHILRVHDVLFFRRFVAVMDAILATSAQ
jgi:dihydropteroate synthase